MGKKHAVFQVTILSGLTPGKKKVQAEEILLGRVDGCDLVLDHKDVSRKHLSVKMAYGQVVIEDLGSSNGTYVNGSEIKPKTPTVVGPTDIVSLGRYIQISIQCDSSEVAPPPTASAADAPDDTAPAINAASSVSSAQPQGHFNPIPNINKRETPPPVPASPPEPQPAPRPLKTETQPKLEIEVPKFDYNAPLPKAIKQNERLYQEVLEARNEAKRLITNAQKQAASIVSEAERLGEVKTQGFYERARRTEAEANELYKQRTEEAHRDAAKIFDEAREEAQTLIAEARQKAQELRDQAEKFSAEMQAESHTKMLELIRAGEAQAKELVAKRAREADEYLERREKELVNEILHNLKEECDEKRAQVARELERLEMESAARVAVTETRNKDLVQEGLDAKIKVDEIKKELEKVAKELDGRKREVSKAFNELQSHKSELEEVMVKLEESRLETSRLRSDFAGLKASLDRALDESRKELAEWQDEKEKRQARWLAENEAKRREWLDANEREINEVSARLAHMKEESDRERAEWLSAKQKERAEWFKAQEKERADWLSNQEKERAEWLATHEREKADWIAAKERFQSQWQSDYEKRQREMIVANEKLALDNEKRQKEAMAANEKAIAESSLRMISLRKEVETFTLERNRLSQQIEEAKAESEATLKAIRSRLEDEKVRIEKQEQERFDQMKVETGRKVEKLEQDLLLEIQQNRVKLAREIVLVMETALSNKLPASQIVELQDVLQDQIAQVLHSPTSVAAGNTTKTHAALGRARRKHQFKHIFTGVGIGAAVALAAVFGQRYVEGNLKPVERMIANSVAEREADLQARKFNPPQDDKWRDSYTDKVIYLEGFTDRYLNSDYQIAYSKAVSYHMLKTFSLPEDKTLQAVARLAALVKTLSERKEKIHPDFVKKGLGQMNELEATTLKEITQDLGSKVRLEALQKFEREYYQNN